jgi:hypothetical protein
MDWIAFRPILGHFVAKVRKKWFSIKHWKILDHAETKLAFAMAVLCIMELGL